VIDTTIHGGSQTGLIGVGAVTAASIVINNYADLRPPTEQTDTAKAVVPCPYPGLAYFGPGDAELFFGRDEAVDKLLKAVGRRGLTALVGASGSGKSSVVLAGLAPRLHREEGWLFSYFRIGYQLDRDPFLALARALVPFYVTSDDATDRLTNTRKLAERLNLGELTLRDVFTECRNRNKGRRILLIADQFEETFTLVADDIVRHRFIDALLAGFPDPTSSSNPDICLILTLRADFYGHALLHRPLADALQGRVENLGPMKREELRSAVVQPAENTEVSFDPGLVETLLNDVESKAGSLPLLQFALREMWGRQENRRITRKSYDTIGGVEGALAQRAEAVFAELTENGANIEVVETFRRLFTRLVMPGEGQEDTRRVVERRELGDGVWSLAQRLAGEGNRLVVTNATAVSLETAELVHEALIRNWPKLVDWVNRDRAFLSWLRQIKANMDLWSTDPSDEGALLRGSMLAQAEDWIDRRGEDLSLVERSFIEASIALRRRAELEKEAARQAEIKRQQELAEAARSISIEQRRRARVAVAGVIVAILLATFGGYEAVDASRQATAARLAEKAALASQEIAESQQAIAIAAAGRARDEEEKAKAEARRADSEARRAMEQAQLAISNQKLMLAGLSLRETDAGRPDRGLRLALAAATTEETLHDVPAVRAAFERAIYHGSLEIGVLKGHKEQVRSAEFSPDGRRIVTTSSDYTVRIWDAESGQERSILDRARIGAMVGVTFSPDGRLIATAQANNATVRIWDADTGRQIRELVPAQLGVPMGSAFTPDGRRIITAGGGNTACIWDVESGQVIVTLSGHTGSVANAAFSPDGQRAATASEDKTARIWDANTGAEIHSLAHEGKISTVAFSPDGRRVLTASEKIARLWDVDSGKEVRSLNHDSSVSTATFSPDGRLIVTASQDKAAHVWDVDTGSQTNVLRGHEDYLFSAAFSSDGRRIVTASNDKTARIWDAETGNETRRPINFDDLVSFVAIDASGQRGVLLAGDILNKRRGVAGIWSPQDGTVVRWLRGHKGGVTSVIFSTNGRLILTASFDGTARLWNAETGEDIGVLQGHRNTVIKASFDPSGQRAVTASWDGTVRIWDVDSQQEITRLRGNTTYVTSVLFSPDGRRVITASPALGFPPRIWDARSGKELLHLNDHGIFAVAFTSDGRRVITAGFQALRVWDVETGQQLRELRGHESTVRTLQISPDGLHAVTTSDDKTMRIWDLEGGQEVFVAKNRADRFSSATFSPDGRRIIAASENTVRIWEVMDSAAIHEKYSYLRNQYHLSSQERADFYLPDLEH
jgi:WD40 repeat protein